MDPPAPPEPVADQQAFLQSVQERTDAWSQYVADLVDSHAWVTEQNRQLATELAEAKEQAARLRGVRNYQQQELASSSKQIIQLSTVVRRIACTDTVCCCVTVLVYRCKQSEWARRAAPR